MSVKVQETPDQSARHSHNAIPISLENPDALTVLRTYWPAGGPTASDDERERNAVKALRTKRPELSEDEAAALACRILEMEEAEYLIAYTFCREIFTHAVSMSASLELIEKEGEGARATNGRSVSRHFWPSISSLLASAGSIHSIFNPASAGKRASNRAETDQRRNHRRRILRSLITLPPDYMKVLKTLRNMHAHLDEHMDDSIEGAKWSGRKLADYVVGSWQGINHNEYVVIRCYDPNTGMLHILKERYDLRSLRDTLLTLQMAISSNVFARGGRYHFGFALAPVPEPCVSFVDRS